MSLRKQATTGLVWTFMQQFGNQIAGFVVSLILARLLHPEEFGLIGMIAVFMAIGKTLLNAGLTQSLIRSNNLDQVDFSTVFFFNLTASLGLYLTMFFAAPLIAEFYGQQILQDLIRVYSIIYIISAFSAVQNARLTKIMDFKTLAIISVPSTVIGGIVGVVLAYTGFGVWSLIWSSLAGALVGTIQLWIYSAWTPSLIFDLKKFKEHFSYGYKLTISEMLNTFFNNLYLIVIGKYFSASQVGFYTRAQTMKQLPVTNISNALNKVTFPLFSKIQDDDIRLKRVYKQLMQMVIFIIAPTLVLLGVLAEPIFRFLFTEKWLPAVPFFQILCATGILYPIHAYNLNILKVKGRSDLFLKLEVYKKILIVIAILIALRFGIIALLWGQVVTSVLAFIINTYYTGKFINYSALEQIKDIFPSLALSSFIGIVVFTLDRMSLHNLQDLYRFILGGFIGLLLFYIGSSIFKFKSLHDLKTLFLKK